MSATRLTTIEKAIKTFELELEKNKEVFNPDLVFPDDGQIDLHFDVGEVHETSKLRPAKQKPKRHPVHEH